MRSPACRRPTSSFTTRWWIAECWRSRGRKRGSNSRASAAAGPPAHQDDISNRLVELARAGHRVLRLKGGDPCVFGRGGEEALALAAAGIPYRVIPGVTAGLAGLTAAGIPATFRGINRAIILAAGYGADDDGVDWAALARTGQPIVLYMAMRNLATIADELMRGGLPPGTAAAIVVAATTADERVVVSTLARVARRCATPPVGHARRSSWSEIS